MFSMTTSVLRGLAAGAGFLLFGMGAAHAAPQILAVAASNAPLPFHCENGVCEVEVSAMCLQENRRFPDPHTVYTPHDDQSFTLVYTNEEGEEQRVVAGDLLTIRSKRSFTAVRVVVPESALGSLGAGELSLHVAGGASLIPQAVDGDFYPQTAVEITRATGPYRDQAAGWLDSGDDRAEASRLVSQVLNELPNEYRMPQSTYEAAWATAEDQRREIMTSGALEHARAIYNQCLETSLHGDYRRCLEKGHDATLYRMNVEYWDSLKAGS